jgi:formylglycine-generating enzyme required for sulfatase activity
MDPISAFLAFWLPASLFGASNVASTTTAAQAGGVCPADMALVEHDHSEFVDHVCTDQRGKHCFAYTPNVTTRRGATEHVRTCMDRYEAPNQRGARPLVMLSGNEAEAWCSSKGKRLCGESEWESACEGNDALPWVYGWKVDTAVCDSDKSWRAFDERALMSSDRDTRERESSRLWQGEPSGQRARCVSSDGVVDLTGNVEEWVTSRPEHHFRLSLMGGFWAKPWTGCRGTNDAHSPDFRFYEVGFRCCRDPSASP